MKKYKKAAINIAFLTFFLSAGLAGSYQAPLNNDADIDWNNDQASYKQERRELIISAFENNDYRAWRQITGQQVGGVNEEVFSRFTAARAAARSGRYSQAIKLTERLKKDIAGRLS